MTAKTSRNTHLPQDDNPQPDLASLLMARAMAETFRNDPDCSLPESLAAIMQRMEVWERDVVGMQAEQETSATPENLGLRN
jgi:hypothetical protein